MNANALVRLKLSSLKDLKTIFEALEPEVSEASTTRSQAFMEKKDLFLLLKIKAEDTVALRAALNAYLRWINSIMKVLEFLQKQ